MNPFALRHSINNFTRSIRIKEFYNGKDSNLHEETRKFHLKSDWTPPANRDKHFDSFRSVIEDDLLIYQACKNYMNLPKVERREMQKFKFDELLRYISDPIEVPNENEILAKNIR